MYITALDRGKNVLDRDTKGKFYDTEDLLLWRAKLRNLSSFQWTSSALWKKSQIKISEHQRSDPSMRNLSISTGKEEQVTSNEMLQCIPLLKCELLDKAQSILSWCLFAPCFCRISYHFVQVLMTHWACPCTERNEGWTCSPRHCPPLICLSMSGIWKGESGLCRRIS